MSIAFTIAGCFALSTNIDIVRNVHWFRVKATNTVGSAALFKVRTTHSVPPRSPSLLSLLLSLLLLLLLFLLLLLLFLLRVPSRWGVSQTSHEEFIVYVGLQSVVYEHSPCTPFGCTLDSYTYGDVEQWPNDFLDHGLGNCRTVANEAAFGAFTTCATLLFALSGTISRMK